ncbi:MAG: hypothetical protein IJV50_07740 [Lachnospiraceae bacterium]|nr:hypothetical protein [Lachnospiraceae bacterium]
MTAMREQAIELVKRMPEDKIYYLLNILENIEELVISQNSVEKTDAQTAYEELQKYRKPGVKERNYKEELYVALEEKYADIN